MYTSTTRRKISVMKREYRQLVPRLLAGCDLTVTRLVELGDQFSCKFRAGLQHFVVNCDGAGDQTHTADPCRLYTHQRHIITLVAVEAHLSVGLIAANVVIGIIATEILDVAQHVSCSVLRQRSPEPCSDTPERCRRLGFSEIFYRKPPNEDKSATVQQLVIQCVERHIQAWHREVLIPYF